MIINHGKLKIAEIETSEIEECQIDGEDFVNFFGLLGKCSSVLSGAN